MSVPSKDRRALGFFVGLLLAALLIAGGLSYFASSAPDGLDTVARNGCVLTEDGEPESGTCIAQNAQDSATAGSPLADYAVGGGEGTTGLAGVLGVVACLAVGGGLFWVLRRRDS
ncbi:MAG: PDGLE domain-containing protein [Pseudonocardia sp.]|uniref:PDGLE domain-containing protein n=1 Tax=Pseudonocardia sp. TaxID=60912 RepID=UPI001AC48300|nr:PDGLE domain-containing protein [Pseudonocardia sp.]MBN9102042.1 PDGLE domain-containing protein [Pseudonocardia sp.]